jgi:hypothetical protein
MTKAEAEAAVKKYGSIRNAAAQLHIRRDTISKLIKGVEVKTKKVAEIKKTAGRSLTEFKNVYDKDTIVPAKIKEGLADLGQSWEYEVEFVKRCGLSFNDIGNYRDQFPDNWLVIRGDGKKVWASVKMIKEMKGML